MLAAMYVIEIGLDASSSLELLQTLHCLALSGRTVILTIHQPRLEIYHLFDKILFLCQGQVRHESLHSVMSVGRPVPRLPILGRHSKLLLSSAKL